MELKERLRLAIVLLVVILVGGTIGYMTIEGWPLLDSAYMTVITLASVGFMEVHELSSGGRIFTIFLILIGLGTLLYVISTVTAFVVEGELRDVLRRRRMERKIKALRNHYVICGFSRMGSQIAQELEKSGRRFVVIEKDAERVEMPDHDDEILTVIGDATLEQVLLDAGLENASGLVTVLAQDQDNLFVVLTARRLNPKLRIVSQVVEENSEAKLRSVGADAVVSSHKIGGMRMASELIRPAVVSFLDVMLRRSDAVYRVEEATVGTHCGWIGHTLGDAAVPEHADVVVVGLKQDGLIVFNPKPDVKIHENDTIIMIGAMEEVEKIRKLAHSAG
ncbi:MAG: potassium channel protein [Candidatus Eisenbacteria sp.]|nr:potassium channel protein [Candidatus Eisenbacteria bacterium]